MAKDNTLYVQSKVMTRKMLTLECCSIGEFHSKHYLPLLQKLRYHKAHVHLLGKNCSGQQRLEAFLSRPSVRCRRDYAERLSAVFDEEIQSEHFGNSRSLSIEGSSVEAHATMGTTPQMTFHSHFSDGSRQDAAATHEHMKCLFTCLQEEGKLAPAMTVWEDTDGCSKQYRCGNALYLLSLLASKYGVTIDRAIGAPGHGKDVVDGLNATDKRYLKKMMCSIAKPEIDEEEGPKMKANSMQGGQLVSLAQECARLCSLQTRVSGVKGVGGKRAKRESEAKLQHRNYHVHKEDEVEFATLSMKAHGFEKGEHQGLLAHYNIRVSSELGLGLAAVRRIPCACPPCRNQMEHPWAPGIEAHKQPCFITNKECHYWQMYCKPDNVTGYNDWKIINLHAKPTTNPTPMLEDKAKKHVLCGLTTRLAQSLQLNGVGAINVEDTAEGGFYLLTWTTEPYTLQEDVYLNEYDPPMRVLTGELVCEGTYWMRVPRAKNWYTQMVEEDGGKTTVRVQQVLVPNLVLEAESSSLKLPNTCNKKHARQKGARYLPATAHDTILEEKCRRERLAFDDEGTAHDDDDFSDTASDDGSVESTDADESTEVGEEHCE